MTKRLISLLLALVLVLSVLPLGIFAEETLPEETLPEETLPEESQPEDSGNPGRCFHLDSALANAAEATCAEAGYTGDLVCNDCGKVLISGFEIPKKDHSFEEGVCTVCGVLESEDPNEEPCYHLDTSVQNMAEVSCTQDGYTGDFVCDACGKVLISGITIPMRDHRYEDGICTECGAAEAGPEETQPEETQPEETQPEQTEPEEDFCFHLNSGILNRTERTCTQDGYTGDLACKDCGEILIPGITIEAEGHSFDAGICNVCGEADPSYTEPEVVRIYGSHRCATALEVADALKRTLGVAKFDTMLYTSGKEFADALAGSYLAARRNAPILLHSDGSFTTNAQYIRENLADNGTVYILGGRNAVPETVDAALNLLGIRTQRLSGETRYETNLAILEEAGFSGGEVLVCNSQNFADSLSASATGLPILLVKDSWEDLRDDQKVFLEGSGSCFFTVIGGESAVSNEMAASLNKLGRVRRLAGPTRYETSVAVAADYFAGPERMVLAYAKNFPDGLCGGVLAYALGAPLVLTADGYGAAAAGYAQEHTVIKGTVLGGPTLISDETVDQIFGQ